MRKVLFFTLVLIALTIGTLGQVGTTNAQGGITPGAPTNGTLSGDSVTYTIDLAAGQLLLASLESDAFDAKLAIQDAGGMELASDDDSGEGTNSLLAFVAQADATYTLVVSAWSGGSGDFVLTPNVVAPVQVEVGGSAMLTANGAEPLYAVFAGTVGSVVNVFTMSQSDDDTQLTLYGVDGQEIEYDYDDGPGYNSYLWCIVLPVDGFYLAEVREVFDYDLTANVDITVEATERLYVDATPQALALSDDALGTEVYTFDATAGTVYRIIVTSALGTGVDLELLDTGDFFSPDFETGNAVRVTWDYRATAGGPFRLVVHPAFFSDGDEYMISMEVVQ
ncbi:MAG: PPC domain-containing protein [Anaerolineae bacterium]|nr:PPC domain-containing protein [Anaerolineae bacterium]